MARPSSGVSTIGEFRVVLIGKTGNGKSATGNTLLNQKVFTSVLSPASVTSECQKARGTVHGRSLAVIDTPGLFDTKYTETQVVHKLKTCIAMSAPGPHAFLIVISLTRFTEEEQKSVELIELLFGPKAARCSMVLFTHGDQLGNVSVESFIRQSPELTRLIRKCNGRYHVFNNQNRTCSLVPELLQKIEQMIVKNGGSYYTNRMFQEAERAVRESMEQILQDNAEKKRQQKAALRAKLTGEKLQIKLREVDNKYKCNNIQAREKAEKKNKFIYSYLVVGAKAGWVIGGALGSVVCDSVGEVVVSLVGGLVGATLGLVPAAVVAIRDQCVTQ